MVRSFAAVRWIAAVVVATLSLHSQTPAAGTLTGRVEMKETGARLKNARVRIPALNREEFTNDFGEFSLGNLPGGPITVEVFYTGMAPASATVVVTPGQAASQVFALEGVKADPLKLATYVVAAQRDANAAAIAVNEQRFSDNLKTVVATDAMGDVAQNNVGEFVKFLPGVNIDTDQMNTVSIGLRGMQASFTTISLDGAGITPAAGGGMDRTVGLQTLSLANASRIEIVKVPTPDMPASSIGGSINLVSRNAFEQRRPETRYRLYANMNSNDLRFTRQPGGNIANKESRTYHVLPSFELTHTNPVSSRFGFSLNAVVNHQYNVARRIDRSFATGVAAANPRKPTVADPYLQSFSFNIFPVYEHRYSLGTRLDWKVSPSATLSFSQSTNYLQQDYEQHSFNFNAGGNPVEWGPTFTHGGTGGGGSANIGLTTRYQRIRNNIFRLSYKFVGNAWDVNASAGFNTSGQWYRATSYGQWERTSARLRGINLNFDDFGPYSPGRVTATDSTGAPVDVFNLNNYRLFLANSNGSTNNTTRDNKGISDDVRADARWKFFGEKINGGVKVGGNLNESYRQRRYGAQSMTYTGRDGIADNADDAIGLAPRPLLDVDFLDVPTIHGYRPLPFPSARAAYQLFEQNPEYWRYTQTNLINDIRERAFGADQTNERIGAFFTQADAKLFHNRLRLVAGARYEQTTDSGRVIKVDNNAQYRHDTAGNLVLDANKKPIPLTTDPVQVAQLIHQRLGTFVRARYDGIYPSLNATYNLTENLQARLGLAKTLGRPNIGDIIGTTTVTTFDFDPDSVATGTALGRIDTKNPNLKPYQSKNLDVSLEYYTAQGGSLTAGFYRKQIENFIANRSFLATPEFLQSIGLSDEFVDYQVNSNYNTPGIVHITGGEFGVTQPLTNLGPVLRDFRVFANYTRTKVVGVNAVNFRGYNPFTWNAGAFYSHGKWSANAKWTLVPKKAVSTATIGAAGFNYQAERSRVDAAVEYRFSPRLGFFLSGRNIFNNTDKGYRYADASPDYVKFTAEGDYGVLFQAGIKGSF